MLAESRIRKALDEVEIREVTDPLDEFQRVISEMVAFKDLLASHIASLEDRLRFTDAKGSEQLRSEVALYERALDRCARFLEVWVKLGLEERVVRLDEARFALVVTALEAYRKAAGVGAEEHRAGLAAMAAELRG